MTNIIKKIWNELKDIFSYSSDKEEEDYIVERYKKRTNNTKYIQIEKKHIPNCEFKGCNKKLHLLNYYHCPYCSGYHCENHRIPEDHGCTNPQLPSYMKKTSSIITYKQ